MLLRFLLGVVLVLSFTVLATIANGEVVYFDPNSPGGDPNSPNDPNLPNDPNIPDPNVPIFTQIQNGGFELIDPNSPLAFVAPLNWMRMPHPLSEYQSDSYAETMHSFKPENKQWKILHPYKEERFVLLSTGGFGVEPNLIVDSQVMGSRIAQPVFLMPGDTILGSYFFGTFDYRPFNDWGCIHFELIDPDNYPDSQQFFEIPASRCDVETVGSYQSTVHLSPETGGWIPFEYTVEPNQLGPYLMVCEVVDWQDDIWESFYAVDNLWICPGGHAQSDFTEDCNVNLVDFEIMSEAWYSFCPDVFDPNTMDPNDIADPNIPCQSADLDNNWLVDPNDLVIFAGDWLNMIFN